MRLLPAKTDHAGSALMGERMRDVCAPDGHSVRQRTPTPQPASEAKVDAEGSTR